MANISKIYVIQEPIDKSNFLTAVDIVNSKLLEKNLLSFSENNKNIIYMSTQDDFKKYKYTNPLINKIDNQLINFTEDDYIYTDGAKDLHAHVLMSLALNLYLKNNEAIIKEIKPGRSRENTILERKLADLIFNY